MEFVEISEQTCTRLSHHARQDTICPLIGVDVKLSVQLAQGQRFGVQREILKANT